MTTTILLMVLCATTTAVDSIAKNKIVKISKIGSDVTIVGYCLYNVTKHMEEIKTAFHIGKKFINMTDIVGKVAIQVIQQIK